MHVRSCATLGVLTLTSVRCESTSTHFLVNLLWKNKSSCNMLDENDKKKTENFPSICSQQL